MTSLKLSALLDDVASDVDTELERMPEVVEKGDNLDPNSLPIAKREWHRADHVISVVADLKSSTRIGLNQRPASVASIYEASTGGVVQIFDEFDADFVAIQGDGAFGLFWGPSAMERATCAAITIKTFSKLHLVPKLETKWPDSLPETGFKIGMAASPLLVKRVGVPRSDHQEPVWAGRAVNYGFKAAQQADRDEMIVTGTVWDWIKDNDYLAVTCGCGSDGVPTTSIWSDVEIEHVPSEDPERQGKLLSTIWCETHGAEYCEAILAGESVREEDAHETAKRARTSERQRIARQVAEQKRRDVANLRRGLAGR